MALLDASAAQALTLPLHETMLAAHRKALAKYMAVMSSEPDFIRPLRAAEKYAILHRHIALELANHPDTKGSYTEALGFSALLVDNKALVRFKHLNNDYQCVAYPTNQQRHLRKQQYTPRMIEQLQFDGMEPPTVLTLGYIETPAGDDFAHVLIVCHTPHLYYAYDIRAAGGVGLPNVIPVPGTEPPAPRVLTKREAHGRRASDVD